MRIEKRLQRIETSLPPKQAVLLWLKENLDLGLLKFSQKLLESPRHQAPRTQISQSVATAMRESLSKRGMRPESIAYVAREAQKEADFLVVLVLDLQRDVLLACEHNMPYEALLHEKLGRMGEQIVNGGRFKRTTWDLWRDVLIQRLTRMWEVKETVKEISGRYYDHQPLLFADLESSLNRQIDSLERLGKHCNTCYRKFADRTGISFNSLLCSVREQVSMAVGERVARAKAKMLEDFGELEAADEVMKPYQLAMLENLRAACTSAQSD